MFSTSSGQDESDTDCFSDSCSSSASSVKSSDSDYGEMPTRFPDVDRFYEGGQPDWAQMQGVVRSGRDPLPAMLRIKKALPEIGDDFWYLSVANIEERGICLHLQPTNNKGAMRGVDSKIYTMNTPQALVRELIQEATIHLFTNFAFRQVSTVVTFQQGLYMPEFSDPKWLIMENLIEYIKEILDRTAFETGLANTNAGTFLRPVLIAEHVYNLSITLLCGKNWNSHGSQVAASIGTLASIISACGKGKLDENFPEMRVQGQVLGGQKHGWEDVMYIEYMIVATPDKDKTPGLTDEIDPNRFRSDKHGEQVKAAFGDIDPATNYHTARPLKCHTTDFTFSVCGVNVLDGECKDSPLEDVQFLLLYSLRQFREKLNALSLHTSSKGMTLFCLFPGPKGSHQIHGVSRKFKPYTLLPAAFPVKVADPDNPQTTGDLPYYKHFRAYGTAAKREITRFKPSEELLGKWKSLAIPLQQFVIAVFDLTDVLVRQLDEMNIENLKQRKKDLYDAGVRNPVFVSANRSRKVTNPEQFLYSPLYGVGAVDAASLGAGEATNAARETLKTHIHQMELRSARKLRIAQEEFALQTGQPVTPSQHAMNTRYQIAMAAAAQQTPTGGVEASVHQTTPAIGLGPRSVYDPHLPTQRQIPNLLHGSPFQVAPEGDEA